MRIVSENSEADLARNAAVAKVEPILRDLTANLMRVARGAGKPYEVGRQTQALIDAMIKYRDATGHFPSSYELTNAVTAERDRRAAVGTVEPRLRNLNQLIVMWTFVIRENRRPNVASLKGRRRQQNRHFLGVRNENDIARFDWA
jgi:hypothetical protein